MTHKHRKGRDATSAEGAAFNSHGREAVVVKIKRASAEGATVQWTEPGKKQMPALAGLKCLMECTIPRPYGRGY